MKQNIFSLYLQWHFWDRPAIILQAWRNCLKFNLNYWSILLLFKTLFSYWRRYRYSYGRGFNPKRYFEVLTFNMISRTIGMIVRTGFIITGLFAEIFIFFTGLLIFLLWLWLPFLIILGIFYGLGLLF